jgi:hypothetical protein
MKLIITENKLNEVINKFIGEFVNDNYIRTKVDNLIVYDEPVAEAADDELYEYDPVVLFYSSENGRLYIKNIFVNTISNMFGLSLDEVMGRIKVWFENENGVTVKFTESDKIPTKYFNDEDNNN